MVSEAAIDLEIERLLEAGRLVESLDPIREVRENDIIVIDYDGCVVLGRNAKRLSFKGGRGKEYQFKMGSEVIAPGFEPHLIGLRTGNTISFNLRFPESHLGELAGLDVLFTVTVRGILDRMRFDNVEQFLAENNIESLAELREIVRITLDGNNSMIA